MEEMLLADKYAKALISVAEEAKLIARVEKELTELEEILKKGSKLEEILRSPLVPVQEKKELLEYIFKEQKVCPELKSFLFLLLKMRRFHLFGQIYQIYKDLIYSLRKRLKVFVESAFTLDVREKNALKVRLSRIYQRDVDLFVQLNPELIGGAKILVGHTLFDGTVKARLNLLKDQICKD